MGKARLFFKTRKTMKYHTQGIGWRERSMEKGSSFGRILPMLEHTSTTKNRGLANIHTEIRVSMKGTGMKESKKG